jgi:DNA-nicking Smr family endonuclease
MALRDYLLRSNRLGRRCVLVVHGKGLHSDQGAPLRETVLHELLGQLSGLVHALATASPADGGEGATYIMLRGTR